MADFALRAITEDGAFRVMAVRTTDTVVRASELQGLSGESARVFADLLTGTVLVRETMAPDLRVQGILQGSNGRSRMVADAHPQGATRGLAQGEGQLLGTGALLQMMRTLHNGSLHQGVVEACGSVSAALMQYMQVSEQVACVVAVGSVAGQGGIVAAGGYLVQLLPELHAEVLSVMTERLGTFPSMAELLSRGTEPSEWLEALLVGMPHARVGESTVRFECGCSDMRVVTSLASLPKSDLEELVGGGKVLEIACDYCRKEYRVDPKTLRGLLVKN
ncbi:MAG: Hsp33 family molecular chaperone HslO [Myxococcales bacterium]